MAYIQHIPILFFLLALMACLNIQFSEGRQLKSMHNAQVTGQKKGLPPMTPTQNHEFSSSDVSNKDAYQPTTPGNSPGIGHSFAGQKDNMQPKRVRVLDEGYTDSFRPTTPGHSPGIGHSKHD
ncbi:hypothetical protein DH2020_050050 [Rehmannia glutinosa]|uniref:Uncharacterized protein n=1 Tax=Rehmannia glutinosa TaxID=99300 RepID=A0ABR0U178_REHGL